MAQALPPYDDEAVNERLLELLRGTNEDTGRTVREVTEALHAQSSMQVFSEAAVRGRLTRMFIEQRIRRVWHFNEKRGAGAYCYFELPGAQKDRAPTRR